MSISEPAGLTTLDENCVRVPVGGASKLSTFVSLIGSNQLKLAVVADASTQDADAIRRLRDAGRLRRGALILMSEITGTANADIEDLFDAAFYIELVNTAYKSELASTPITLADLPRRTARITKRVDAVFAKRKIAGGKVNHLRPALALLSQQDELLAKIDDETSQRFATLAQRVNEALK